MHSPEAIYPLGERALLISFANRILPSINRSVLHLADLLRQSSLPFEDVVPAYASILVTLGEACDPDDMTSAIQNLSNEITVTDDETTNRATRTHTVPVSYGGSMGPDLDDVAHNHQLTRDEVIRRHAGAEYRVNFLGFLPGFAYLATLPRTLGTPRLPSPRTQVPAGSVALAGLQTAIYPFSSPGGWRLIGRTGLQVWDPFRADPALLLPGDSVRFVPSDSTPEPAMPHSEPRSAGTPALEVISTAGPTTVQDFGRPGLAHLGVARGGVSDLPAAFRANALVGNSPNAALLEMTWQGPALRAAQNITIALAGADMKCRIDGHPISNELSWFVRQGSLIEFSPVTAEGNGLRTYLAVAGGIEVPVVLGSRSTSLQAHFGGYSGRVISTGDVLNGGTLAVDPALISGRFWPGSTRGTPPNPTAIRYVPYLGRGAAMSTARSIFSRLTFECTAESDRMGVRLRPLEIERLPTGGPELLSLGVVRGAIQLPPGGHPIVLGADHQTTGGYPLLGVVPQVDWPILAQLKPGSHVRFEQISATEARSMQVQANQELQRSLVRLRGLYPDLTV